MEIHSSIGKLALNKAMLPKNSYNVETYLYHFRHSKQILREFARVFELCSTFDGKKKPKCWIFF